MDLGRERAERVATVRDDDCGAARGNPLILDADRRRSGGGCRRHEIMPVGRKPPHCDEQNARPGRTRVMGYIVDLDQAVTDHPADNSAGEVS